MKRFFVLLSLVAGAFSPLSNANEIKTFMGIDMNTPFIPHFYENSFESEKEGIMYEVPMPEDSLFKTAQVVMGLKDYPYMVKGCTEDSTVTQIAEVLEIKYAHYDKYTRVHYNPLDDYRFGAKVGNLLVKTFKENYRGDDGELVFLSCASIQNLAMPNYEWLSKQDDNPITLFRDL